MNVGALLDFVAGELDAQVLGYMQKYTIPPSLMDKALDRIQSHMRQMKSEEYANELLEMAMQQAEQNQGTETASPDAQETKPVPQPISGDEVTDEIKEGLEEFEKNGFSSQTETKTGTIEEFKKEIGMKQEDKDADI